jgi:hypothetical protein
LRYKYAVDISFILTRSDFMKKQIMALAAAAAVSLPMAASAADVTWGGEYSATGYVTETTATTENAGFYQTLKVKPTFKLDNNISLVTSITLYEANWLGDHRLAGGAGSNAGDGSENISLDLGYLQMPLAGGTLRVGRQEANWGHNLTITEDGRDRVLYMKRIGGVTTLAVYDKRQEGAINDDGDQDGDMYAVGAIGMASGWMWGILADYWDGKAPYDYAGTTPALNPGGYVLEDLLGIHPFISGKAGPVGIKAAANYLTGNGDGLGLWSNDSLSMFVRAEMEMGALKLEGQVLYVMDGGLVDTGFDTFSSMISNAPRNTRNVMNLRNMGGLGGDDDDQTLVAVRATFAMNDSLKLIGAFGSADAEDQYNGYFGTPPGFGWKATFVEAGVDYALTKQVGFFGKVGSLDIDGGDRLTAMSAGVKAAF